jgi:hypothetical protein
MQIVINIPEKIKQTFDNAKEEDLYGNYYDYNSLIGKAIKNGIQLPEGHGRLIDADALEKKMCDREEELGDDRALWESSAVSVALDMFAPTIIEKDRSEGV